MRHWSNDASLFSALLDRAAGAMLSSPFRQGCVVRLPRRGRILATGDLHDHTAHLAAVLRLAKLEESSRNSVVLHELIHPEMTADGIDRSYRMLARTAELVLEYPMQVHPLLANHEIAQCMGQAISKGGGDNVAAFDAGLEWAFGDGAEEASDAVGRFIRAMPLAIKADNGLMISHSLPADAAFRRFDTRVLERDLYEEDLEYPDGAAYLLTWGRNHSPGLLSALAEEWGVRTFIVGHTHVPGGIERRAPNMVVLNSDTPEGRVVFVDLERDVADAETLIADSIALADQLEPDVGPLTGRGGA